MEQQGKIDKAKEEYQHGENKLMQERRRLTRELNKQNYQKKRRRCEYDPEYAARTHRLVIKGGVFEHFYPETSEQGRLHEKQEIVNEYDRTHRYAARDNQRKRDENNLS